MSYKCPFCSRTSDNQSLIMMHMIDRHPDRAPNGVVDLYAWSQPQIIADAVATQQV